MSLQTSEKQITRKFVDWLNMQPGVFARKRLGSVANRFWPDVSGFVTLDPDRVVMMVGELARKAGFSDLDRPERFGETLGSLPVTIEIEMKMRSGKPTKGQEKKVDFLGKSGVITGVAYDLAEAKELFERKLLECEGRLAAFCFSYVLIGRRSLSDDRSLKPED